MLTDGNLTAELECIRKFVHVGPGDGFLGVLPLFHVLAQMANLFLPLGNGGKVVFLDSLNTQELMLALRERGITIFCCVPQFFYLIHERIFGEVAKKGRLAEKIFAHHARPQHGIAEAGLQSRQGVLQESARSSLGPTFATLSPAARALMPRSGATFKPSASRCCKPLA